jgi:hypothetical protein
MPGTDFSSAGDRRFVLKIAVNHCGSIEQERGNTPCEMNGAPLATWHWQRGPGHLFGEVALR